MVEPGISRIGMVSTKLSKNERSGFSGLESETGIYS